MRDAAVQTCRTTRPASLVWPLFRQALYLSTYLFVYEACDHSNVGSTASENASDCTAQVISTVSRRLGTLYSTDFPTTTGEKSLRLPRSPSIEPPSPSWHGKRAAVVVAVFFHFDATTSKQRPVSRTDKG